MEKRTALECRGIHKEFGPKPVLFDVNLRIARGQIVALVGPSGCGKSTLLNIILGMLNASRGEVFTYDAGEPKRVMRPGRDRGIVYQHYAIFPFLTAAENVAFGPMLDQTSIPFRLFRQIAWRRKRRQYLAEARALLERVRITSPDAYPHELSGGMRQRVAIAQALIMQPAVLLLDEPFGALDESTREDLQTMLLEFYAENCAAQERGEEPPHTMLIVTHELTEAIYVADRVIGLSQYWDWKAEGHAVCPGATIVYDKTAPVFKPGDPKEAEMFVRQRTEIRDVVFEPSVLQQRGQHVTFWDDVKAGRAEGVLAR